MSNVTDLFAAEDSNDEAPPSLSDFHQLLLMRLLRPDRFPTALANYVTQHFNLNPEDMPTPNLDMVLDGVRAGHQGVLVLLPPSPANSDIPIPSSVKLVQEPKDIIAQIAQVS